MVLLILSAVSLFIGVFDISISGLFSGDAQQLGVFLASRPPRLLAILCTGVGMSVAGLIMQQLCMNKFVSHTTGATVSAAGFGVLTAIIPASTLWSRAIVSFVFAILGTWIFVAFIQRVKFKDVVMVPLVGIMFGNVLTGLTNFIAYKYDMTQQLSGWLTGNFSMVLQGRYEIVYLVVPLVILAFVFANYFNIVAMFRGDKIRGTLIDAALFGGLFVLVSDIIARVIITPYEMPIELIVGIVGSIRIHLYDYLSAEIRTKIGETGEIPAQRSGGERR